MNPYFFTMPRLCGVYFLPRPTPKQELNNSWEIYNDLRAVWLPLVSMSSHSKLNDISSYTTLSQSFTNPSKTVSIPEAKYTFPLYENCAVRSFTCYVEDRVLEGVVKEKDRAKTEYKEAVERGENAALLEQHHPDVFTTKIGNIGPGETIKVEIGYIMELKHDAEADGLRFTIPTSIAPRYGTPPPGVFGAEEYTAVAIDKSGGISISVEISMASNVRSVQSPSHPIRLSLGAHKPDCPDDQFNPKHALASLSHTSTELGKDFVLIVACADLSSPRAILETHNTIPNSKALMVTLVPKFKLPPGPKPEVVFVVDRSGSMSDKITSLKSALEVFLKSLPLGVKFNICSFGSSHSFLWPNSKNYTADTLKQAEIHITDFQADFGGTEILPPIQASIDRRLKDLQLEIFVLTDGEVWNKDELFTYVEENTRDGDVRVFSLGIGEDVSHSLVEGLARIGRGFAQIVGNSGEGLEGKVVRMLRGGLSTHVKDYRLEWDGRVEPELKLASSAGDAPRSSDAGGNVKISLFDVEADTDASRPKVADDVKSRFDDLLPFEVPAVLQAPYKLPPLFPFSRTTVYCILSGSAADVPPKSVWLKGTTNSGIELELEIPVQIAEGKDITIHQLAARKILQELEEGTGYLHSDRYGVDPEKQPGQFKDWIEREGERIGLLYQIGSHWTSFVAVEKKKKKGVSHPNIDDGDKRTPSDAVMDNESEDYDIIGEIDDIGSGSSSRLPAAARPVFAAPAAFSFCSMPTASTHAFGISSFGSAAFSATPPMMQLSAPTMPFHSSAFGSTPSLHQSSGSFFGASSEVAHASTSIRKLLESKLPEEALGGNPLLDGGGDLLGDSDSVEDVVCASVEDLFMDSPVPDDLVGTAIESPVPDLPRTPARTTTALICLQSFQGSFPSRESLASLLGIELGVLDDKVSEAKTLSEALSKEVWATALAVAMFELRLKSEKDTWDLVVEKAREWMESIVGAAEVDILVKKAGETLPDA